MRIVLTLFLVTGLLLRSQGQNLYDFNHTAVFADHLFKTKQYALAAAEYERLLFLAPGADSLQVRLLQAYQGSGNTRFGLQRAAALYPQRHSMPARVASQYTRMLFQEKAFARADSFLVVAGNLAADDRFLLQATSQAYAQNWQSAQAYLDRINPATKPVVAQYRSLLEKAGQQRYKSPALAAGLSAVVPGAGKLYTKDWKDGLISFVMVTSSFWQSYRSFNKAGSGSVRGWIFASVGTGFYFGNIFGSHKAARLYNQKLKTQTHQKIEALLSVPL